MNQPVRSELKKESFTIQCVSMIEKAQLSRAVKSAAVHQEPIEALHHVSLLTSYD